MQLQINPTDGLSVIRPSKGLRHRGWQKYRVQMYGNLSEVLIFDTQKESLKKLQKMSEKTLARRVSTLTAQQRAQARGYDLMHSFRCLNEQYGRFSACGMVIDNELLAIVEDENGDQIYDFTTSLKTSVRYQAANDNGERNVSLGDYYDIIDDDHYDEDGDVTIGVVKAQSFETGYIEQTFINKKGFDPKLLDLDINDFGNWFSTGRMSYDGYKPIDIEWVRNPTAPTAVSLELVHV